MEKLTIICDGNVEIFNDYQGRFFRYLQDFKFEPTKCVVSGNKDDKYTVVIYGSEQVDCAISRIKDRGKSYGITSVLSEERVRVYDIQHEYNIALKDMK